MIKLLSLNIEGKRHLDRVENLILKVKPDVFCVQEIFEEDLENFYKFGFIKHEYAHMLLKPKINETLNKTDYISFGTAIFSKIKNSEYTKKYYFRDENSTRFHRSGIHNDLSMAVVNNKFNLDSKNYNILTTHFCVSKNGQADDFQREQIKSLLSVLDEIGNFVLCGDMNAPRGREIFSILNDRYKDNINKKYTTSIDPDLHKAGDLQLMVDVLFSTNDYIVKNMYFETGVSDHYGIVAEIE